MSETLYEAIPAADLPVEVKDLTVVPLEEVAKSGCFKMCLIFI